MNVRSRRHFRVGGREIGAAGARVITGDFEFEFAGFVVCQSAEYHHAVFESRQRLQNRCEFVSVAHSRRRPLVHDDAVWHRERMKGAWPSWMRSEPRKRRPETSRPAAAAPVRFPPRAETCAGELIS